ncbi:MAG: hypothetical protein JWP82_3265 [Humibacillus sp.]|nr:hypothetical protein [Humibacillus sp.]
MSVVDVRYVLPDDAEAVPLPDAEEVILGRRGSRVAPQLLSADAMALLDHFRAPSTLTRAVLAYCATTGADPVATLDDAFPVLVALTRADLLVAEGSDEATLFEDRRRIGDRAGPATITSRLRTLRDSEVWRGVLDDGTAVVVKIVDEPRLGADLVAREVAALRRLAPRPEADTDTDTGLRVPELQWHEASLTGGTLVMSEVVGDPLDVATLDLDQDGRRRVVLDLLGAYAELHERGVLHGDVHAGNVLLASDGLLTLIDFGLADVTGPGGVEAPPPRAAGGEGLDPACAAALLAGEPLPPLDAAAEQYAVAALAHRILTGSAHLDLATSRTEALERIVSHEPLRFAAVGAPAWPSGERVLRRALATRAGDRHTSVRRLRDAFAAALVVHPSDPTSTGDTELAGAVSALDVDGRAWALADADESRHAAWFLHRVAELTGDVTAHDLAALWRVRAGAGAPAGPRTDEAVTRAHDELAAYCRTGGEVHRSRARAIATRLGTAPVWRVDVHRGRWASALLALECERPADATRPGAV